MWIHAGKFYQIASENARIGYLNISRNQREVSVISILENWLQVSSGRNNDIVASEKCVSKLSNNLREKDYKKRS